MELTSVRTESAPTAGRVRLVGEVTYDDQPGRREAYWFEVAEENAHELSSTGNPWLICLTPLAARLGQRLRLPLPVDRLLLRNVREVVAIWCAWHRELRPITISAETIDEPVRPAGSRTGACFSGGVDSFFTVLRSLEPGALPIDDLLTIGGFDILLDNLAAFERRRQRIAEVAAQLGKGVVDVVTNLRSTRVEECGWAGLLHGAGLASVGFALEGRFRRLIIASGYDYANLKPLGSHPLTDSLLSSAQTEILHDGAAYDRCAKTEYVSRSQVALQHLHVCFRSGSDRNCGGCEKCYRTMAVLDVVGRLPAASSFPSDQFQPSRLSRAFLPTQGHESFYLALGELSKRNGRRDLLRASNRAMARSRWIRRGLRLADWLAARRGLWRASGPLRRALLAGEMR